MPIIHTAERPYRDQPGSVFVRKGLIITTSSKTRLDGPARGLFSHPYTDQPAAHGDQLKNQRVSRVNLFREPGAPVTIDHQAGH